jgi:hypothetical protein
VASDDDKIRVKLRGELRLLEMSLSRLLKCVDTDLPPPKSARAAHAANARWRRAENQTRAGPVRDRVRVPGIYEDRLRREHEHVERSHTVYDDAGNVVFARNTHLLDALDAGEAVKVAAWRLSSEHVRVPEHMRPGKCPDGWWRVTPDDVVERPVSPVVDRVRVPTTRRRAVARNAR